MIGWEHSLFLASSLFLVINMARADLMLGTLQLAPPMFVYFVGLDYQFWSAGLPTYFTASYLIADVFFSQASLLRQLSYLARDFTPLIGHISRIQDYHYEHTGIVICLVWVVSLVFIAIFTTLSLFILSKHDIYIFLDDIRPDSYVHQMWL